MSLIILASVNEKFCVSVFTETKSKNVKNCIKGKIELVIKTHDRYSLKPVILKCPHSSKAKKFSNYIHSLISCLVTLTQELDRKSRGTSFLEAFNVNVIHSQT